jgi:hypothetical protein
MTRKYLLTRLIPTIIAILLFSILMANLLYPKAYDWRYMVISELQNKHNNSVGYLFSAIGILISSILMIPMLGYYYRKLSKICKGTMIFAMIFFIIAITGGICLGTVDHLPHTVEKFHEMLGMMLMLGLFLTMLLFNCPIFKDRVYAGGAKQFNMKIWAIIQVILWVPFIGIAASLIGMEVIPNDWGWPGIDWIEKGAPVVLSFALWEWVMFVSIIIDMALFGYLVPETIVPFQKKRKKLE